MPSDRALQPPKEKDAAEGVPLVNLRVESTLTPLLGEFRLDDLQCARPDGGAFGESEAAKPPRLSPDIDVR